MLLKLKTIHNIVFGFEKYLFKSREYNKLWINIQLSYWF